MRILELGPVPVVKPVYPDETMLVGTGRDPLPIGDPTAFDLSPGKLGRVLALLKDHSIDALFVTRLSSQRDAIIPVIFRLLTDHRSLRRGVPLLRIFGDRIVRLGAAAPIIVYDPSDAPFVPRQALWLWAVATAVFKRELPLDRWQLFMRTAHADVPTPRFRKLPYYQAIIDKVRPMSLGLPAESERALPSHIPAKTTDVFFAGEIKANSSVRDAGIRELLALRDRGVSVDLPNARLTLDEFLRRCGQARLVWSPQGFGHDCFRHYEAAACGSVPLISRSPIEQYAPFRDGETAIFYDPEPGGLTRRVVSALERREELRVMGMAARGHVLAFHSAKARVDHMVATVLINPALRG
jgi:hypothetical protein